MSLDDHRTITGSPTDQQPPCRRRINPGWTSAVVVVLALAYREHLAQRARLLAGDEMDVARHDRVIWAKAMSADTISRCHMCASGCALIVALYLRSTPSVELRGLCSVTGIYSTGAIESEVRAASGGA
jgi:hypothetical protein